MKLTVKSNNIKNLLQNEYGNFHLVKNTDNLSIAYQTDKNYDLNSNDYGNSIVTIDLPDNIFVANEATVSEYPIQFNTHDTNQNYRILDKYVFNNSDITDFSTSSRILVSENDPLWEFVQPLPKAFHNQRNPDTGALELLYYKDYGTSSFNYNDILLHYPELSASVYTKSYIKNYAYNSKNKNFQLLSLSGEISAPTKYIDDNIFEISGNSIHKTLDSDIKAPEKDIKDFTQYGDYIFNLSQETFFRNEYTKTTNKIDPQTGRYIIPGNTEIFQFINDQVTYYPKSHYNQYPELSADMRFRINNRIENTNFDFFNRKMVFGFEDNNGYLNVFVKDQTSPTVDQKWQWPVSGLAYQYTDGIPANYMIEMSDGLGATSGKYLTDFNFKMKNMYNADFDLITDEQRTISAVRNYHQIGLTQDYLWTSYKVIRDYDYSESPAISNFNSERYYTQYSPEQRFSLDRNKYIIDPIQNYEFIETIKGFFKFSGYNKHKSNIFSITINNAGINSLSGDFELRDNDNNLVTYMSNDEVKSTLKDLIETELKKIIEQIKPGYTELWKIEWKGK